MLDQCRAKGAHRRIFLKRVAMGHDDGDGQARCARGARLRLAMVAARRRDDAGHLRMGAPQPVDIGNGAARLERARRRVIFMLHPDRAAGARRQQGPGILRRRRHLRMDHGCGRTEGGKREIGHPARLWGRRGIGQDRWAESGPVRPPCALRRPAAGADAFPPTPCVRADRPAKPAQRSGSRPSPHRSAPGSIA